MSRPQLVAMAADLQDANSIAVKAGQTLFKVAWHGDPLPRHRPAILQPGRADFAYWNLQAFGNLPREILRPDIAFLNPEVEKLAAAGRQIRRNLFHLEVLGRRLEATAETGKIAGEHGRREEVRMMVHAGWFMKAGGNFSFVFGDGEEYDQTTFLANQSSEAATR